MSKTRSQILPPERSGRRAPSPLTLTIFVLVLGFGGLLLWLQWSYQEPGERPPMTAAATVAVGATSEGNETPPAESADTTEVAKPPAVGGVAKPAPDQAAPNQAAPAWARHARPFQDEAGRPRVAILIWGLGLSRAETTSAIQKLPGEITLAFATYGRNLQELADEARGRGHEIVLQVPMEPYDYPKNDPGPHTLLTTLDTKDNIERLDWVLKRFEGYVGITSQLGARFTRSAEHLGPVLRALKSRELIFLDSRRSGEGLGYEIAGLVGLDRAANDRFIDDEVDRDAIDAELAALEETARTRGSAIGIGFPYPITIQRLLLWAETLEARGITLAPLSAVHVAGKTG